MKKYRVLIFIEWPSFDEKRIIKGSYYYYKNNQIKQSRTEYNNLRDECEWVSTFE